MATTRLDALTPADFGREVTMEVSGVTITGTLHGLMDGGLDHVRVNLRGTPSWPVLAASQEVAVSDEVRVD